MLKVIFHNKTTGVFIPLIYSDIKINIFFQNHLKIIIAFLIDIEKRVIRKGHSLNVNVIIKVNSDKEKYQNPIILFNYHLNVFNYKHFTKKLFRIINSNKYKHDFSYYQINNLSFVYSIVG
jgi:hypothetical protein